MFKKILIAVVVILVVVQFIPVERTNPPVTENINSPENISAILRVSCYDCHSNETQWPWYSYVVPVSFLVTGDVNKGRKHLNFSEWDKYDDKKKDKKLEEIIEVVEENEMPLPKYLIIHSDAEIDSEKLRMLKEWVVSTNAEDEPVRYKKEIEND